MRRPRLGRVIAGLVDLVQLTGVFHPEPFQDRRHVILYRLRGVGVVRILHQPEQPIVRHFVDERTGIGVFGQEHNAPAVGQSAQLAGGALKKAGAFVRRLRWRGGGFAYFALACCAKLRAANICPLFQAALNRSSDNP